MTSIRYQGHTLELPPEAAVIWATGTMVSPLEIVRTLHWAQYYAMPGRSIGMCLRVIDSAVQQLRENAQIVDDARILQAINKILPCLEAVAAAAWEIREWQESHVSKKIITAHNKATREHGPLDPPWRHVEEFNAKLEKSSSAFSNYLDALIEVIPIIREVLPPGVTASSLEQLDRVLEQIPDIQIILRVGYREAIRRKAAEMGYSPPT